MKSPLPPVLARSSLELPLPLMWYDGGEMQRLFLPALVLASAFFSVAPTPAEAGCRCGRSYISESYTCHKCPCECPSCDYRDCAVPEARYTPARMTLASGQAKGAPVHSSKAQGPSR